jgi:DNA-directed RNA polymerase subunit RPC12/RpoP
VEHIDGNNRVSCQNCGKTIEAVGDVVEYTFAQTSTSEVPERDLLICLVFLIMMVTPFLHYVFLMLPVMILWWIIRQSRHEDTPLTTVYTHTRGRDPDDQGIVMRCSNCELSYRYFMSAIESVDGSVACQNCGQRIEGTAFSADPEASGEGLDIS